MASESERIPVLFDTDIGSDIDDAVALAYLLRQPRCELLGVTTVTGDVQQRAACADVVCRAAGRDDVPIHTGAADVILHGPGQPHVPHFPSIADRVTGRTWPADAVGFLRDTIRRRPGEVTLLSVGPLTNIALLFALDPEIPSLLRSFVSMGGAFTPDVGHAEWNVYADPVAAAMVYARSGPGHVSIGLDVTMRCRLDAAAVRERFRRPPLDAVLTMAEAFFAHQGEVITFHDPLAAAVVFRPELCTYAAGTVTAATNEGDGMGRTAFAADPGGAHRTAVDVDVDGFFAEYFGVTG